MDYCGNTLLPLMDTLPDNPWTALRERRWLTDSDLAPATYPGAAVFRSIHSASPQARSSGSQPGSWGDQDNLLPGRVNPV